MIEAWAGSALWTRFSTFASTMLATIAFVSAKCTNSVAHTRRVPSRQPHILRIHSVQRALIRAGAARKAMRCLAKSQMRHSAISARNTLRYALRAVAVIRMLR